MSIEEGLKLETDREDGKIEIPDCSRQDLPEFFVGRGYKVGAEIGVDRGDFTELLCKEGLEIYGIDPWKMYPDYMYGKGQKGLNENWEFSKERLAKYNCHLIRKTSMDAVEDFEDESLDFVYIDGHHGFRYVAEDLWEWNKKVKVGGVIAGHDYALNTKPPYHPYTLHVKYVLEAFLKTLKIKKWYVLGRYEKLPGEKRDSWRSWMWIKPQSYIIQTT